MITKPFGKNIQIEPIENKQVLVSDQGSLCEYGKVIAVGSDVKEIKVGDTIGYLVWGINSLKVGEKKYYFVPETDDFILGHVEI